METIKIKSEYPIGPFVSAAKGRRRRHTFTVEFIRTAEHRELAVNFLREHFHKEHPMTRLFGLSEDEMALAFDEIWREALREPISLMALEEGSGEIAAIKLHSICDQPNRNFSGTEWSDRCEQQTSIKVHENVKNKDGAEEEETIGEEKLATALSSLRGMKNGMEKYRTFFGIMLNNFIPKFLPEAKRVLKFAGIVVQQKFAGYGLATELVLRSLAVGRLNGCDQAIVCASAKVSQCVMRKCGFVVRRRVQYAAIGDPMFLRLHDGATACEVCSQQL